MMRWIVNSSLRFRRLVVAAAAGVMVLGIVQVAKTPVDILPEFSPPTVEVQTEALGLSAAEVEQLITVPLEQDLLVGVPFLDEIESVSLPGLSSVVMTFEPGTDLLDARQVVQERLTQAVGIAGLPAVAKTPQMIQPVSSNSRLSMVKLTSEELTAIDMSVLARWVITPRLLAVPGVANISVWGNRDRQLQVQVDPQRLRENGVTLSQVITTAGNSLEVSPLSYLEASKPGTGGFIDTANQRLNIFHEQAISTPDELAQVPLVGRDGERVTSSTGDPVTLGDMTNVVEDHQPLIGDTACSGGEKCLLLVIEKFPGVDTVQVADDVEHALEALAPGLADMQFDSSVYRPASYIESTLQDLVGALLLGMLLLLLLIVAVFWDWRRSVIAFAAIVVSAATAVLVLHARGTTINLLVVAGLVIGITALIDDAVTDADALASTLRRDRGANHDRSIWSMVVDTSTGTRRSLLYAAMIVAAAALPFLFLEGQGGAFLPPIALSYLLAVAASMLVALTLTPVLGMLLLSKASLRRGESPVAEWLRRHNDRIAPRLVTRTGAGLAGLGLLAVVGLAAAPFLDTSLRPSVNERDVVVQLEAAPGTSLTRMTTLAAQAVEELRELPGVADANAQVGRAVMSDKAVDVDKAEIWVNLHPGADYNDTLAFIESTVAGYPAFTSQVTTYTEQRVREELQPVAHDVVVRVYGENSDVLEAKAEEVRRALSQVSGITQVNVEATPEEPTIEVEVDLNRAQDLGIKPGDVRRAAASLLGGITVGNLFEEQKVFDVVVWGAPDIRENVRDIERLLIDTPSGRSIRLQDVAEIRNVPNRAVIRHASVSPYMEVTADVGGRDVADVNREVASVLDTIQFPLDHHAEVLGGYAERQAERAGLIAVALAAVIAIFLLLQAAFRSWRLAIVSFVALSVVLVGGLVANLFAGGTLGPGSIAGLLVVLGIAARGLIMLVRHFQHLERHEGMAFGPELVVRGVGDRLAPTLATALAMAAFLVPIAVIGADTGLALLHLTAITVLGGLVTATLVNLVLVPIVYLRFGSVPDTDSWADELFEPIPDLEPARG